MEAIKQLQQEGYVVALDGENIRCQKVKGSNPDPKRVHLLFDELKRRKLEAIEYLKRQNRSHMEFDRQIRIVIEQLNQARVRLMDFPPEIRKRSLKLEEAMTQAANKGEKEEFLNILKEWRNCFR